MSNVAFKVVFRAFKEPRKIIKNSYVSRFFKNIILLMQRSSFLNPLLNLLEKLLSNPNLIFKVKFLRGDLDGALDLLNVVITKADPDFKYTQSIIYLNTMSDDSYKEKVVFFLKEEAFLKYDTLADKTEDMQQAHILVSVLSAQYQYAIKLMQDNYECLTSTYVLNTVVKTINKYGIPELISVRDVEFAVDYLKVLNKIYEGRPNKVVAPISSTLLRELAVCDQHSVVERYIDAVSKKLGYDSIYARRTSNAIVEGRIKRFHLSGGKSDLPHPLLDPIVFSNFVDNQKHGVKKIGSPLIVKWIESIQHERPLIASKKLTPFKSSQRPKLLLVSHKNWNFMTPVMEEIEAIFEIRFFPFELLELALNSKKGRKSSDWTLRDMLLSVGPYEIKPEEVYAVLQELTPWAIELIEWSDVVFVEWWSDAAVWFSKYLDRNKKLVIRCHSYEAFSKWPALTNMKGVDKGIFIADHIESIFKFVSFFPDYVDTTSIVENKRDVSNFEFQKKDEDAKFTLGLTQFSSVNKDPIFALKILEQLVSQDRRWKLRLAGKQWDSVVNAEDQQYRDDFEQAYESLKANIVFDGYVDDMSNWYKSIGYILSTSYREGSHESIVEGMLTGSVPVIRDWPMVKAFGGPAKLFEGVPLFTKTIDMVKYILEMQSCYEKYSNQSYARAKSLFIELPQKSLSLEIYKTFKEEKNGSS